MSPTGPALCARAFLVARCDACAAQEALGTPLGPASPTVDYWILSDISNARS